jgi:SRSO17 transposase
LLTRVTDRLREFVRPFADRLGYRVQQTHVESYVVGLASGLRRKNVESIAYLHDQDRRNLQHFIGESAWDHRPLQAELVNQVAQELGESDGVIVFDPSAFAKKGTESVGVARQWCGRLGKVDNCQVGVYMGYVSRQEHSLVDARLYLPKSWARDRKQRKKCGVPQQVKYQTRHGLALEMLEQQRAILPHGWIAGDDEMGRPTHFRRELAALNEKYLLAVPSNTTVRDLEGASPAYQGHGAKPKRSFEQVRHWAASLPESMWTNVEVRDGEKGPLAMQMVKRRVEARTEKRRVGPEETLVVTRTLDEKADAKYDYYLSNAPIQTPLQEFARVIHAEHRIEECIKRAKSEAGLADYEVRTWLGWHHHQVLSMIATWFLVQETRRGKKIDAGIDRSPGPRCDRADSSTGTLTRHAAASRPEQSTPIATKRTGTLLPLETP